MGRVCLHEYQDVGDICLRWIRDRGERKVAIDDGVVREEFPFSFKRFVKILCDGES